MALSGRRRWKGWWRWRQEGGVLDVNGCKEEEEEGVTTLSVLAARRRVL